MSGRTLVIAEKPSVAVEIAKLLGIEATGTQRGKGYLEGSAYIVSWALGHLVNIAEPGEQDAAWKGRWSLKNLPMIPRRFVLSVLPERRRQFEVLSSLLSRDDVTEVLNATDAGREGELIFRRIYIKAGCNKPIRRLWAGDMTEEGLRKAFDAVFEGERKRNLGLAAFARAEADWLIGMNFSRLFTLKTGRLITVGRVQTPVLKMLVDRRRAVENFVSSVYHTVEAHCGVGDDTFDATWFAPPEFKEKRIDEPDEADEIVRACDGKVATVLSAEGRKGRQKPPLPYDLTTLQRDCNKRFGFPAKKTLSIAQALYEDKKVLTYPRTDSRYLTTELFNEILDHLRAVYAHLPELCEKAAVRIKSGKHKFACVNDRKVSDHHAIVPTCKKVSRRQLDEDQWVVYETVFRRFTAAFLPDCAFRSTTLWLEMAGHRFKSTGKVFIDRGWLDAEPWRSTEDKPLPDLAKDDVVAVGSVASKRHKTKPPAHFTDASLLGAMETAGTLVEDEALREAMKDRGLGTPATRAQIIENLVSREYVVKKGKKLIASDKGCHAVDTVAANLPDLASPEMTGRWEKKLKEIEMGELTYPEFMKEIRKLVSEGVKSIRDRRLEGCDFPDAEVGTEEKIGDCPVCGGAVVETDRAFGCANWRERNGSCRFTIWKHSFGIELDKSQVHILLEHGALPGELELESRSGKKFRAGLILKDGRLTPSFDRRRRDASPEQDHSTREDRPNEGHE